MDSYPEPYQQDKTERPKKKARRVPVKEIKRQEKAMSNVYLVCAVMKATVREQEDGKGDTLAGELKAVCATSAAGAISQYTRDMLKDVKDLTAVDVLVKNL